MITSKDLKEWGVPEGPAFGAALKVFNGPRCELGRARAEKLMRAVLADPEAHRGDGVAAPP